MPIPTTTSPAPSRPSPSAWQGHALTGSSVYQSLRAEQMLAERAICQSTSNHRHASVLEQALGNLGLAKAFSQRATRILWHCIGTYSITLASCWWVGGHVSSASHRWRVAHRCGMHGVWRGWCADRLGKAQALETSMLAGCGVVGVGVLTWP
eukprot:8852050-Alexandrium_andersonii.AAC.1